MHQNSRERKPLDVPQIAITKAAESTDTKCILDECALDEVRIAHPSFQRWDFDGGIRPCYWIGDWSASRFNAAMMLGEVK